MRQRAVALGFAAFLVVVSGSLQAATAQAQRGRSQGGPIQWAGAPEARIIEANADALGLDADTLAAIKAAAETGRAAAQAKFEAVNEARRRLEALLREPYPDEATLIRDTEAVGNAMTENLKERMRTSRTIRGLLSEEQRVKLAEIRGQRGARTGNSPGPPIGPPPARAVDRGGAGEK